MNARQNGIQLLRWLCVPLAAWLGNYVGYIVGGALMLLAQALGAVNPPSDDSSSNRLLRYLLWLLPVGLTVVVAAAKTAPRWQLAVACMAALLWTVGTSRIHGFAGPTIIAAPVAACCGIALVLCLEKRQRRRQKQLLHRVF